jgi:hypothetical protein
MNEQGNTDSKDSKNLLSLSRNLILFAAIYLYFIGWVHVHFFYSDFGISINSLDIPFYYFFIYSYAAFYYVFASIWGFLSLLVIAIIIIALARIIKKIPESITKCVILVCLIVLFSTFFAMSKISGPREASDMRISKDNKKVTLVFKKDIAEQLPREFIEANESGNLKLLTQTKNRFYIFCQKPPEEGGLHTTYEISKADLYLAEIEKPNEKANHPKK